MKTYEVLEGDPFGGYYTIGQGLTYEEAEKLSAQADIESDYFTTTQIKEEKK